MTFQKKNRMQFHFFLESSTSVSSVAAFPRKAQYSGVARYGFTPAHEGEIDNNQNVLTINESSI